MDKKKILIVDDEPDLVRILNKLLTNAGFAVFNAQDGEEALKMVKRIMPDLILLDIMMPGMDGWEVKKRLNADKNTANVPVIFLTVKDTVPDKVMGLNLGADDYITKPFDRKELLARIKSAIGRRKAYEEISMTDGLTGLYNVHFFKKQMSIFFHIARRHQQMFSLSIVDVDNFKMINDTYGHAAGDFVLENIAAAMKETLRKSDIITRYGGDEFAIILPKHDKAAAAQAMERIRGKINDRVFEHAGIKIPVSVSVGIAVYDDQVRDENKLFEMADADMYRDKKAAKGHK